MPTGLTIKQWAQGRYLEVCNALQDIRQRPQDLEHNKIAFIRLSLEAQQLKQFVPRRLHKLANKGA